MTAWPWHRDREEKPRPKSLQGIQPLFWLDLKQYAPCIYFLVDEGEVVYVGQTTCLPSRVQDHLKRRAAWRTALSKNRRAVEFEFEDVFCFPVPETDLDAVEGAFIRFFKPKLNGTYKGKPGGVIQAPGGLGDPKKDAEILAVYGFTGGSTRPATG